MPKKDAQEMAVCDGCGREMSADQIGEANDRGMAYCGTCDERRRDDPPVTIHNRTMPLSEFEAQADEDEHLAAARGGDTLEEQIKAARRAARDR